MKIKFNKTVYALKNTKTNTLLAPVKLFARCWFRGLYDTRKSAEKALKLFVKNIKEFKDLGYDEYSIYNGEYVVVEINEVDTNE